MHELLLNQWFMYTSLFLNAVVAGHILWFAINISNSKILRAAVFTLGAAYAISCGGIFKAPGFIVNPQVIVFWLFINSLIGLYMFASLFKTLKIHSCSLIYPIDVSTGKKMDDSSQVKELNQIENLKYSDNKFNDRNIIDNELIGTFFGMPSKIISELVAGLPAPISSSIRPIMRKNAAACAASTIRGAAAL